MALAVHTKALSRSQIKCAVTSPASPRLASPRKPVVLCTAGLGLTPYQGTMRSFGFFRCTDCSRSRQSGNSWADCGQQCRGCLIIIYPHRQLPLSKSGKGKNDPTKPHPQELCGKCQQLGYSCRLLHNRTKAIGTAQ